MTAAPQPVFAALADPVLRQLLEDLSPRTATRLAKSYYPKTRQSILKHLNVLEDAGLVTVYQGREKRYSLTPAPSASSTGGLKTSTPSGTRAWQGLRHRCRVKKSNW